ncbi:MAG: ATP-binding protein, partial [Acidimicrobiales bacterium]
MYPDGVWFVDLAPLAADALVPAAIAGILGLRQEPGRPFADTVCEYLSSRHALVMFDNCEHLADGAGTIVDQLLRAAPGVRVLATSRERLGVPGETAWTVPPLADPDAVRLFVDRARSAAPAASVDGDPAVIEVCRRLDGVPLAIELAAARVSVLPVGQIASRLDDALRLLGEASRTTPLRQRTLRATIEWSYELLTGTERALFDRLAVFPGAFTLEAAEAVGACPELAGPDVLDYFARLVDKSLVLLQAGEDGTVHYRLLETLRQYGTSRLVAENGLAGARAAHAAYYLALAEKEAPGLHQPGSGDCLRGLTAEAHNFRTALEWAFAE